MVATALAPIPPDELTVNPGRTEILMATTPGWRDSLGGKCRRAGAPLALYLLPPYLLRLLPNDHCPRDQPAFPLDQVHKVDAGSQPPRCAQRDHVAASTEAARLPPAHFTPTHVVSHQGRRPGARESEAHAQIPARVRYRALERQLEARLAHSEGCGDHEPFAHAEHAAHLESTLVFGPGAASSVRRPRHHHCHPRLLGRGARDSPPARSHSGGSRRCRCRRARPAARARASPSPSAPSNAGSACSG